MNKSFKRLIPTDITFANIKKWFFPDIKNIDKNIQKTFYRQATQSLFLLILLTFVVSGFIFIISFASNINVLLLAKSLSGFIIFFVIISLIHKFFRTEKIDYHLLIISILFISTWGIFKDIINFDIIFNRYGIIFISLLFFGLIFMPFPPYISLLLGCYCALLYGTMWLLFIYQIFGQEWISQIGTSTNIKWLNTFINHITNEKFYFPHWRYHSTWYFFQFILFGIISSIFRAANLQAYINTYFTNEKLLNTESDLNAIKSILTKTENQYIEFKSSTRWDYTNNCVNKNLEEVIIKTIIGFMNSEGGTLLLGVDDEGTPIGLNKDYNTLKKNNQDGYELFLINLISKYAGKDYCANIHITFMPIKHIEICSIKIKQSMTPIFIEKMEQALFVRTGNSTQKLNTKEAFMYIKKHFNNI